MLRPNVLDVDRAFVLLIDLQEKLLPLIVAKERLVARVQTLLAGADIFTLPILVTEQYPKGLGRTEARVASALSSKRFQTIEKPTFSAWGTEAVRRAMREIDRSQAVIVGIESHVCVQLTALDLRAVDFDVFVCADAVGSRSLIDHEAALDRMRQEGVYVTTVESVLFELCGRCDAPLFKRMLEIVKADPPAEK